MINSKESWMSKVEYDATRKSNLSFQVGAEILNLSLLYADLMFYHM